MKDMLIKSKVNIQRRWKRTRVGHKMCGMNGGARYMCTLCPETQITQVPTFGENMGDQWRKST